jgi:hypothetical protein
LNALATVDAVGIFQGGVVEGCNKGVRSATSEIYDAVALDRKAGPDTTTAKHAFIMIPYNQWVCIVTRDRLVIRPEGNSLNSVFVHKLLQFAGAGCFTEQAIVIAISQKEFKDRFPHADHSLGLCVDDHTIRSRGGTGRR